MLLLADLVIIGLVTSMLLVAIWRGRRRAGRARAARAAAGGIDLIPGRPVAAPSRPAAPAPPRALPGPAPGRRATWSASCERGELAPAPTPNPPVPAPAREPGDGDLQVPSPAPTPAARPAVVVAPRGRSWVVRRDGASRVSSVHTSREAAEVRARKTARRERVVFEVRDADEHVVDRVDFRGSVAVSAGSDA